MELVVVSVISVCKIQQQQQLSYKKGQMNTEYITLCCNCMLMAIVLRSIGEEPKYNKKKKFNVAHSNMYMNNNVSSYYVNDHPYCELSIIS